MGTVPLLESASFRTFFQGSAKQLRSKCHFKVSQLPKTLEIRIKSIGLEFRTSCSKGTRIKDIVPFQDKLRFIYR
jgi:hypothetical protein